VQVQKWGIGKVEKHGMVRDRQQGIVIGGSILLALILVLLGGCQGLPKNVANCAVVPAPPANTSIVPPASEPPPAALCGFPLEISAPVKGESVSSPVPLVAIASPPDPIYTVRVYVDGFAVLYTPRSIVNQLLWMPDGQHTVEVVAEDTAGYIATTSMQLNVSGQQPGALNIQDSPDWVSCSAVLASGSTCAAGLGVAASTLDLHQQSPSLDGSAAKFSLGGKHSYSNELYWTPLGGGRNVSHFSYDLWFYIDDGEAPQSLEFDVNQAFGGKRWTWGTQCDFNDSHRWDIWDPLNEVWKPTDVPCNHFPSNTWIHLIWNFERVGEQVHYINVSVADHVYDVDTYYTAQPDWFQEEIDIAFQMDGNYKQQPYNVWLDEVNLLAF
jgi:hypothetical protein